MASILIATAVAAFGGAEPAAWTHAYDLDGDGRHDRIEARHTGGAHCCYRLTVQLTSGSQRYELPFQLDGGYVGGLDLSKPRQFSIHATAGAAPELRMEIETYNGVPQSLPAEWARRYGIRGHHIGVSFPQGKMRVRNLP